MTYTIKNRGFFCVNLKFSGHQLTFANCKNLIKIPSGMLSNLNRYKQSPGATIRNAECADYVVSLFKMVVPPFANRYENNTMLCSGMPGITLTLIVRNYYPSTIAEGTEKEHIDFLSMPGIR